MSLTPFEGQVGNPDDNIKLLVECEQVDELFTYSYELIFPPREHMYLGEVRALAEGARVAHERLLLLVERLKNDPDSDGEDNP